jgi:putative membrane protein
MGVVTGFPYGEFSYAAKLGPRIGGLVPWTLPVSWVPLVLGAVAATERVDRPNSQLHWLSWGAAAALLLVAFDGVLDPGAAHLGFWVWPTGGAYYGVPLSNYAGWMLSSLAASALLLVLAPWRQTQPLAGMLDSALISLAFWSAVNAVAGITVPALLGVALFAFMLWRRSALQLTRSV